MLDGIRWVLFDAVGTLLYPELPVAEVYWSAGQRFGSRLSIDQIRERFYTALASHQNNGGPTSETQERERWRTIVGQVLDDVPANIEEVFEELWRHFSQPARWRLYDDVAPTLSALSRAGYKLGIASNFDARLHGIVRGHRDLAACEIVFVSSEVGYTKPDGRFFCEVERRLEVDGSRIALVGDDEVADVQGAGAAGWRAIWLERQQGNAGSSSIRTLSKLSC